MLKLDEFIMQESPFRFVTGKNSEQGSLEWLEFRQDKIGSSSVSAIMGKSPWDTPYSLYQSMVTGSSKKMTSAMQRGKDEEPKALAWINDKLYMQFEPCVIQSVERPYMIASLDGFFSDGINWTGCEIKTPGREDHLVAVEGKIPEKYMCQLQHQMYVSGCSRWIYVSWTGDPETSKYLWVERNEKMIEEQLEACDAFYSNFVKGIAPKMSEKDWNERRDLEDLAIDYKMIDAKIQSLVQQKEEIKTKILENLNGMERVRIGELLKIQKITSRGSIDYASIPQLKAMDLEPYRKDSKVSWRFD